MRVLKEITRRARLLRNQPTAAEAMRWEYLRKGRLMGYKFRRQHVVRKYILDFFCPAVSLGIELDGAVHDEQKEHDMFGSDGLRELGIQILRFSNERVLKNVEAVVGEISHTLKNIAHNAPHPQAGEAGRGT